MQQQAINPPYRYDQSANYDIVTGKVFGVPP